MLCSTTRYGILRRPLRASSRTRIRLVALLRLRKCATRWDKKKSEPGLPGKLSESVLVGSDLAEQLLFLVFSE